MVKNRRTNQSECFTLGLPLFRNVATLIFLFYYESFFALSYGEEAHQLANAIN